MQKITSFFLTFCAVLFFSFPGAAAAKNDDGYITYKFKRGDTLIEIAQRYFKSPRNYRIVQRHNRIANAKLIPVGRNIRISRAFLKFSPSKARLVSVRGRVLRSRSVAKRGDIVREGTSLTTSASSFVSLALEDGSTISLPSNSSMRITRLRKYLLGGSLDYDFAVSRGGARSKVRRHKSRDDRYRVRSPKAVSAVRGTDFQMRFDEVTNSDFAEVVEGALAVNTGNATDLPLPAERGLAVAANGAVQQEALLAPPSLIEPGKTQTKQKLTFAVKPVTSEAGYRLTWATDAGFVDQVADITTANPQISVDGFENGNYFIRARAISKAGIQGMPATYAFRRRLNDVKGSAGKSDDGFAFKWFAAGDGVQRFHFQLFRGNKDSVAMIDEAGLSESSIAISDLPAGEYFWRVGSVLYLDGEATTDWTDFEKITLSE